MPQPIYSQVHINAALSDISVAYIQDNDNFIADKVFPPVPVVHQSDDYYVFSKDDFLRDEVQQRSDGTESAGGGFNLTNKTYGAKVWGYHKDIGPQVRANQDPAIDIDVATTKFIMQKHLIRRDRLFASTYMTTGVWGTDITGVAAAPSGNQTIQWSDSSSDPITDIENGQTQILQNTGMLPNKLVVGWPVYQALKKHPLIIDRVKYSMKALGSEITADLIAQALDIDELVVSKAVYNAASEGLTGSYSFAIGKTALLCHVAPSPGLMVPSAGYIFPWTGYRNMTSTMGVVIYQVPMDWLGMGTIRTEGEMAFDMQIVSSDLGYFFNTIVA